MVNMIYDVGQKFKSKCSGRIATVVHTHKRHCLLDYKDGSVDLFTMVDMDIIFEPHREPIQYSVELWGNEFKQGPETMLVCRVFGDLPSWNSGEKTERCPIKYRITVEEIPE
jgi:hypothetical protein